MSSKYMMVIDDYGDGEKRGGECEIWKEKRDNYDNECHLKNRDSGCVSVMI